MFFLLFSCCGKVKPFIHEVAPLTMIENGNCTRSLSIAPTLRQPPVSTPGSEPKLAVFAF
jgi:hypothetical protein